MVNYPPWPLHLSYGDRELNLFGPLADLTLAAAPDLGTLVYQPWNPGEFPKIDQVERLLAVGLGLRQMRLDITRAAGGVRPRILLGGPVQSMGWLPGLVEEALCSLRLNAPLFLIGSCGGAAGVVADLLVHGTERADPVMTEECAARVVTVERDGVKESAYEPARALAAKLELPFDARRPVAEEIAMIGKRGLANALCNGLDDAENRELLVAKDGRRIMELVLKGLASLPAALPAF